MGATNYCKELSGAISLIINGESDGIEPAIVLIQFGSSRSTSQDLISTGSCLFGGRSPGSSDTVVSTDIRLSQRRRPTSQIEANVDDLFSGGEWQHSKNRFQPGVSVALRAKGKGPRSQFNRFLVLKFPSCPIRSAEHELISVQLELDVRDVQDCLYSFRGVRRSGRG